jgi:hypothetical protein
LPVSGIALKLLPCGQGVMMALMNDEDFVNLKYDVDRHESDLVKPAPSDCPSIASSPFTPTETVSGWKPITQAIAITYSATSILTMSFS